MRYSICVQYWDLDNNLAGARFYASRLNQLFLGIEAS